MAKKIPSSSYSDSSKPVLSVSLVLKMNLEILTALIVLNGFWKQSSLAATSVTTALEVIFNKMRNVNLRFTYLLTY